MSDHPENMEPAKIDKDACDLVSSPNEIISAYDEAAERGKAARAVGFLEGMSMWLWTQIGPDLDDEVVAKYDRRVAEIAAYIGLPSREVDAK